LRGRGILMASLQAFVIARTFATTIPLAFVRDVVNVAFFTGLEMA
jgi:hypothetical protein